MAQSQTDLDELDAERGSVMTPQRRQALLDLGADLPRAWEHPNAGNESRKRILRAVLKEIVVRVGGTQLELMVHWQGGDHTELSVVKNRIGRHRWTTDTAVERKEAALERVERRELSAFMRDQRTEQRIRDRGEDGAMPSHR